MQAIHLTTYFFILSVSDTSFSYSFSRSLCVSSFPFFFQIFMHISVSTIFLPIFLLFIYFSSTTCVTFWHWVCDSLFLRFSSSFFLPFFLWVFLSISVLVFPFVSCLFKFLSRCLSDTIRNRQDARTTVHSRRRRGTLSARGPNQEENVFAGHIVNNTYMLSLYTNVGVVKLILN